MHNTAQDKQTQTNIRKRERELNNIASERDARTREIERERSEEKLKELEKEIDWVERARERENKRRS